MLDTEQAQDDGSWSSRVLTVLGWAYGVGLLLVTVCVASYPGTTPGDQAVAIWLTALWVFVVVYWLARIFASARRLRSSSRRALVRILPSTVLLVSGIALVMSEAPLQVRFELSEIELVRVVRELPANDQGTIDRQAGLYDVREFWRLPDDVILLRTHGCGFKGTCGFAYITERRPGPVCANSDYRAYEHLSGPWYEFTWKAEQFC